MPVVGEVSDGVLSDNRRFPISAAHVEQALTSASAEPPAQGAVGGGAGTICYDLKGGIGSASRVVPQGWTVGALVQTNYGVLRNLTIAGVPVGLELDVPVLPEPPEPQPPEGSCIVLVATDAPLLPHQLRRLALRGSVGLTRSGSYTGHSSGEITLAFSTATRIGLGPGPTIEVPAVRDTSNPAFLDLFEATVEAVHEAVLNSLFEATTTVGFQGATVHAIPVDQTLEILARHGALGRVGG
jgi:D-aminopeptidase